MQKFVSLLFLVLCVFLPPGCTVPQKESIQHDLSMQLRAPLDGIWKGEFDIGGRGPFDFTAIHLDGKAYAYSERAKAMCVGTVELDGAKYASTYALFVMDGGPFDVAKLTGNVSGGNEIASHFVTMNGGDTGAMNLAYDTVYEVPSSLERVSGTWSYTDRDNLTTAFSIASDGRIQGQDSDSCVYDGQLGIIDPSYNAYRLVMNISGCSSVDGEYEGVTFLAQDQLSVQVANAKYALFFAFSREP